MSIGTYTPPPLANQYTKKNSNYLFLFFHFRCILLQISHKKCFFISISILGRSGVNVTTSSYNYCHCRIYKTVVNSSQFVIILTI